METQISMLKFLLIKPLKRLHDDFKENIEDDTLTVKKVAPGPDTEVFNIQREDLKKEMVSRSKSVPNLKEKFNTELKRKVSKEIGSKLDSKMSERIAR